VVLVFGAGLSPIGVSAGSNPDNPLSALVYGALPGNYPGNLMWGGAGNQEPSDLPGRGPNM
jgi:hypothetical protein